MSLMSSVICVFAGIVFYVGIYHLAASLHLRDYTRHLSLSLICLLVVLMMAAQLVVVHSTHASHHLLANKLAILCVLCICALLLWFAAQRIHLPRPWVAAALAPGALLALVNLAQPYSLQFTTITGLAEQTMFWGEPLLRLQGQLSSWLWFCCAWILAILALVGLIALNRWRRLGETTDLAIAWCMALCWLANLYGSAIRLGWDGLPYTGIMSIALMILVISMVFIQEDTRERRKGGERLRAIFDGAPDGIMVVGNDGMIKVANPGLERLFESGEQTLVGKPLEELVPDAYRHSHQQLRSHYQQAPRIRAMSGSKALPARSCSGREFPSDVSLAPIDWNGERATLAFVRDASERIAQASHLEWLATHDETTHLPNRSGLQRFLRSHTLPQDYWLAMIGIDNLGRINEAFGHEKGDAVIQAIAARLLEFKQAAEFCARFEGDHFVFISASAKRADTLHKTLQAPVVLGEGLRLQVSVCMGYLQAGSEEPAQMLQHAQSALVHAKLAGHGAIEQFDAQHLSRDRRWLDMYAALKQREFSLVYQPRVALGSNPGHSFEVLVRWHAAEGLISPGEFIPIAEKSGFILPLGDWIMEQALVQMRHWLDQGHPLNRVAVNVSMRQLVTPTFVPKVLSLLSHYGIPAHSLELEVTETAAMENLAFVANSLHQLAEAGITLAMDDFGTGYSSLAYLQKLPFRVIKIDMSFVRRLGTPEGDELMQGMLALIRNLKRDIVAEGIETQEQLDWLRQAGCDEGQGFYLSRPLSVEDASRWLQQRA